MKLGWQFDYPGVVFDNFIIEQFAPDSGLTDPWLPLVVVPALQCDPEDPADIGSPQHHQGQHPHAYHDP